MKHFVLALLVFLSVLQTTNAQNSGVVYVKLQEEIAPSASRLIRKALDKATEENAEAVLIEMDTYGGLLVDADSIRKSILDHPQPVVVFINKNAGSAGALISLACDKIYMAPGATIGSSTVVNGNGEVLPDKYQSYMRSIMRSTAESHGQDTMVDANGDTTCRYKRDPRIAEAMVDDRIAIPGLIDSGKIVAFTTSEAIENRYCEGEAKSKDDVLKAIDLEDAKIIPVVKSSLDKVIGFLAKPALQGTLLVIIFWGIFFEIRTPGIGFPLAAAVGAALLYFAPLYLDGLAANWEILMFLVGLILIGLEIFVIPGFGVAGISGILLTLGSLILSLIRNVDFDFSTSSELEISNALTVVLFAMVGFIIGLVLFGRGMSSSPLFKRLILSTTLEDAKAGIHIPERDNFDLMHKSGVAHTDIRPMGKAKIEGEIIDVKSMGQFIPKGSPVRVIAKELGYYVVETDNIA